MTIKNHFRKYKKGFSIYSQFPEYMNNKENHNMDIITKYKTQDEIINRKCDRRNKIRKQLFPSHDTPEDKKKRNKISENCVRVKAGGYITETSFESDNDLNKMKQKLKNELEISVLKRSPNNTASNRNDEVIQNRSSIMEKIIWFFQSIFSERPPEMTWDKYHNLKEIDCFLCRMQRRFSSLVKLITIGTTCQNRRIKVLRISKTETYNDTIVIEAGIHAREWVTPATATYIINYLLTKWKDLPEHLTNKTWIFFPLVNPDGYYYTWTKDRLWRKNRKKHAESDNYGIDLNRNFSVGWLQNRHDDPAHLNYKGTRQFSERESRAIRDFLIPIKEYLKAYIALHTYGQEIRFHWGLKEEISDLQRVEKVAELGAKKMSKIYKEYYSVGKPKNSAIFGNSRDWARKRLGIKYSYLIELRDRGIYGFLLPENEIIPTAEEALEFIATVAMAIDQDKKNEVSSSKISRTTSTRNSNSYE